MGEYVLEVFAAVVVSNILQSWLTVQGIKVHIGYLKQGMDRAHARIDKLTSSRDGG